MTGLKSENCGAWASEAKPEKPKMKLRFGSKLIFTLFSGAVLIGSVALIGGTPPAAAQCNNSISLPSLKSVVHGFYAKGSGSGTRAVVTYYTSIGTSIQHTYDIADKSWQSNPLTYTTTAPQYVQYAEIKFQTDPGQYLYVSSTSFG